MNNIHFAEKGGAPEPAVLCEEHALRVAPFGAVSEPVDPSDEPCVVCFARYKDELIEVATDIIGADGSGMPSFLNLVAGLLEARTEGDDEGADVFRAALGGIEWAITNALEIRFDRFNVGDAVVFTREVARPPARHRPLRLAGRRRTQPERIHLHQARPPRHRRRLRGV